MPRPRIPAVTRLHEDGEALAETAFYLSGDVTRLATISR